jgi:hypothetical protein
MLELYGELLSELAGILEPHGKALVEYDGAAAWDNDEKQVILGDEAVLELGGAGLPAVSMVLCVSRRDMGDAPVRLYGQDLGSLCHAGKGVVNVPYARISIVGIDPAFLQEEFKLYQLIRSIEYVRYHVSPVGYMPRISTMRGREQVRVSRAAVTGGLDLGIVGSVYNGAYCAHPAVEWAKTTFVTLADADFAGLKGIADRAEAYVMSLDHPLNNLNMDCGSCNLKVVCDEAEKLCR